MNRQWKFGLTLASLFGFVLYILGIAFAIVWFDISPAERTLVRELLSERVVVLALFLFVLLVGLGSILQRLFQIYTHTARLHEETQLIATANPAHRIELPNEPESRRLAATINRLAEQYEALQRNVEARINTARAELEEEKEILAALMAELSEAVLVCNVEGQILLYNQRARQLFDHPVELRVAGNGHHSPLVGLGRSIFSILDRGLFVHAIDQIHEQQARGNRQPVIPFITTAGNDQLFSVRVAPLHDRDGTVSGFVLTLDDITRRFASSQRRATLLHTLIERTRASLANMRAAVETMVEYPDLERERMQEFTRIIHIEALALSDHLAHTVSAADTDLAGPWLLEEITGADLLALLRGRLQQAAGMPISCDPVSETLWLKIDSYALVRVLSELVRRLHSHAGVPELILRLAPQERFTGLDLRWQGTAVENDELQLWIDQPALDDARGQAVSLRAVAERHGGEVWYQSDSAARHGYVRLLLPVTEPQAQGPTQPAWTSRPEFYDFDLFRQTERSAELDDRRLSELSFTVFDTETTGLDPLVDEIIAIGAVRIVNGRLLRHEVFDQLVDPRRPLNSESISIHGIEPHMLQGQPLIEQVLPRFARFAEDTVLVAHNAAFDMRFLQQKEAQAEVHFDLPVLDTLLLAAVVRPSHTDHSLEALARSFGVNIIGRHTALGDAIVTGEILLKLLRMLNEQGIVTLRDAREASQKTLLARIEY